MSIKTYKAAVEEWQTLALRAGGVPWLALFPLNACMIKLLYTFGECRFVGTTNDEVDRLSSSLKENVQRYCEDTNVDQTTKKVSTYDTLAWLSLKVGERIYPVERLGQDALKVLGSALNARDMHGAFTRVLRK